MEKKLNTGDVYCANCGSAIQSNNISNETEINLKNKGNIKKDSSLSVVAAVLSLIPYFSFIAAILALIDLVMNDTEKKAWTFYICTMFLCFVGYFICLFYIINIYNSLILEPYIQRYLA